MPSEFNHIDDFFRSKEQEANVDERLQEMHWQQMKAALVHPVKQPAKNRKWYWLAAAGIIAVGTLTFLLKNKNISSATATNKSLPASKQQLIHPNKQTNIVVNPVPVQQVKTVIFKPTIKTKTLFVIKSQADTIIAETNFPYYKKTIVNEQQLFNNFFQDLNSPPEQFTVNTTADTTIVCKQGTILHIPALAFQTALSLPVNTLIEFSVKECYSVNDIVANKLSTTSNGNALVTGGMIFLQAKSGTQELELRPGKTVDVQMPTERFDSRMQLFTRQTNTNSSSLQDSVAIMSEVNWIPMGQQQVFYPANSKTITVLNLSNNPEEIYYKRPNNPAKRKLVARFLISWHCSYSKEEIKAMLEKKFLRYYDEIKVSREWKPLFRKDRRYDTTKGPQSLYESRYVGDTVTLHISAATRRGYITRDDSLQYEAKWKKDLEEAIQRNQSYQDLMEKRSKYNFKIASLGWINCDRFRNYPKELLTDFVVSGEDVFNQSYFHSLLIFKNENVMMQGHTDRGKLIFPRIPLGNNVSIVCIGVKDGKVLSCVEDMVVNKEGVKSLKFEENTPDELKEKLSRFNNVTR